MSDTTGSDPHGERPDEGNDQPPPYPPQQPYGQPQQPFGAPPPNPSPYGEQPPGQEPEGAPARSYTQQYGQQYGQQPSPQGYGQPGYGSGYAGYGQPTSERRPATVTAAGVITLIMSGLSAAGFALLLVALAVARDEVVQELRNTQDLGGIDPDDVVSVLNVALVAFLVWCAVAMVLAIFAMRRSNGARIGLVVSAALAGLLSLLSITSLITVIPLVACIVAIVCLFAGGASAWFARRHGYPSGSGGLAPPIA
jgi:hypothetical protein